MCPVWQGLGVLTRRASARRRCDRTSRCRTCAPPISCRACDASLPGESLLDPHATTRIIERLRNPPLGDRLLASFGHQEQRILSLLAEGLTNRQIAQEMFLADQTVKHDVSNTLTKLGMSRRPEAAVYAARHVSRGGGPTRAG